MGSINNNNNNNNINNNRTAEETERWLEEHILLRHYVNPCGPPWLRGPHVGNHCCKGFEMLCDVLFKDRRGFFDFFRVYSFLFNDAVREIIYRY